jgi:hypothetical protein
VFISGFVNAAMYSRALEAGGLRAAIRKLSSRMSRLYLVHIVTMTLSLTVLAARPCRLQTRWTFMCLLAEFEAR